MIATINAYGDALVQTTGTHGADIASQRVDSLDHRSLVEALGWFPRIGVCVDLGCGLGAQGLRFAALGHRCHLYDLLPESPLLHSVRTQSPFALTYRSCDLRQATTADFPAHIDLAFSQRFLHYLRYAEAERLVALVASRMDRGARFFASASGIDSELGDGYAAKQRGLQDRFDTLATAMQEKHDIREPVCLYREADLEALMQRVGLVCRSIERSVFGNIKGVFEKA